MQIFGRGGQGPPDGEIDIYLSAAKIYEIRVPGRPWRPSGSCDTRITSRFSRIARDSLEMSRGSLLIRSGEAKIAQSACPRLSLGRAWPASQVTISLPYHLRLLLGDGELPTAEACPRLAQALLRAAVAPERVIRVADNEHLCRIRLSPKPS